MTANTSLKSQLEERLQAIEQLTAGINDEKAGQAPAEGEWCVKEVLSHLAGSETRSFYDGMKLFLDEEMPEYDQGIGESYFDSSRANASVADLRGRVLGQYRRIGELLDGLSEEQLQRKAHMPNFKETPLGDYPTLGAWAAGLINFHIPDHITQLENLCK